LCCLVIAVWVIVMAVIPISPVSCIAHHIAEGFSDLAWPRLRRYYEETLNTLKYANRAKNIKTTSTRVVNEVDQHIAQYVNIISDLRSEIAQLKSQRRAPVPPEPVASSSGGGASRSSSRSQDKADEQRDRHEKVEMEKLRSAIQGNFLEKRDVKSQLIELNDLNLSNKIQISKKQLEVHRWEKENATTDKAVPSWVAAARNDIKTAKANVTKNTRLQRELVSRERDLVEECEMLREQVRRVPLIEERRMLLEQDFAVKELEIEKMQMQQLAKTHANQLQDRDLRVRKLVQQVEASNDLIRRQKNVLEEHDIRTDDLGEVPFSPPGVDGARGGDPMRRSTHRHGTASDRGGHSRFPEIRTSGTNHGSHRTRSRQRSREGLLGQMSRLTASRERAASRDRGGRASSRDRGGSWDTGGEKGPPVLVTVTPRRERERERQIESRVGHGHYSSKDPSPDRMHHHHRLGHGSSRPSSIDPSVRSNELEYGQYGGRHGTGSYEKATGRRMTARSSPSDRGGIGGGGGGGGSKYPRAPRDTVRRKEPLSYHHRPREGFGADRKSGATGRGRGGQPHHTPMRRPRSGYSVGTNSSSEYAASGRRRR
jgi:hypothetical protein